MRIPIARIVIDVAGIDGGLLLHLDGLHGKHSLSCSLFHRPFQHAPTGPFPRRDQCVAGNRIDPQLGVGATTRFDTLADFTTMSVGRSGGDRFIRAVAPGENIVSAIPGGRYGVWSGTSMAAPIVSGIAALIRARDAVSAPHSIVERISETGILWDYAHPTRGLIKTNRVDALCAVTNNRACSVP